MSNLDEQAVDEQLGAYLRQQLDGQMGRAAEGFAQTQRFERRMRIWRRLAAGGALAAAASVAALLMIHAAHRGSAGGPGNGEPPIVKVDDSSQEPRELERTLAWRTVDDGTVLIGGSEPMRQLRREVYEHVQWYDPQQRTTIEMSVPTEEVIFVKMNKY